MNQNLTNVLMFTAGAALGAVVTWKLVKTKYEQIAREEIESVKKVYSKKNQEQKEEPEKKPQVTVTRDKPDLKEYRNLMRSAGYINDEEEGEPDDSGGPYVIEEDEFAEGDYETIGLTYYADKVLADDMSNEIIEDVAATVGNKALIEFEKFNDDNFRVDVVYVRNDILQIDYEIMRDERNYSDVVRETV